MTLSIAASMESSDGIKIGSKPVKRLFKIVNGATPKTDVPEYWDGDVVWVTPEDVSATKTANIKSSRRMISVDGYRNCGTTLVGAGSIVLTTRAPIGNVALADIPLCTNQGCKSLVALSSDVMPRFFYYQFASLAANLNALGNGATFVELSASELGRMRLAAPSLDIQVAISNFLDHETAKGDALIAKYERLIELLDEKHASLVTETLTKGLNSKVPLKDSGIEWIGRIPRHWNVMRMKRCTLGETGSIKPGPFGSDLIQDEMLSGPVKVFSQRNIIDNDFESGDLFISEQKFRELRAFSVKPGDLLMTSRGTIGRCAVAPAHIGSAVIHPCVIRVRLDPKIADQAYFSRLLGGSKLVQDQFAFNSNATTIGVIYSDTVRSLVVPVPPLVEQKNLIAALTAIDQRLDVMRMRAVEAIGLLREFRSSLIAAAVSGQIDSKRYESKRIGVTG